MRKIVREREPIGIRIKEFFHLQQTDNLLSEKFKQQLGHEPDGLIFQPINDVSTMLISLSSILVI
jgi:mRNA-capping enzyme